MISAVFTWADTYVFDAYVEQKSKHVVTLEIHISRKANYQTIEFSKRDFHVRIIFRCDILTIPLFQTEFYLIVQRQFSLVVSWQNATYRKAIFKFLSTLVHI